MFTFDLKGGIANLTQILTNPKDEIYSFIHSEPPSIGESDDQKLKFLRLKD
jgi:hypothetical protein